MANPSASNVAYAELAPHSIHVAILSGRKVIATRAFSLDAKADLASFVAEHQVSGAVRAALVGGRNYLHRSGDAESGAVRQPGALQAHAGKMAHGFDGVPVAVAVDAATGTAPDATRVTPWLLAAVDAAALANAREILGAAGLAPTDVTLAAPAHFGAVAGSLAAGETALVLVPGDDDAQLAWVTSAGVQAVATAPVGYAKIYEAVQLGLGLKFKAAAGKLFYNENYDFSDAGPKIAEPVAAQLKGVLGAQPVTHLHVVGLVPSQAWLVAQVAKLLGVNAWSPSAAALAGRLSLEMDPSLVSAGSAGLLQVASAGSSDAAWVQSTLDTLAARPRNTAAPFPVAKSAASVAAAPVAAQPASAPVVSVAVQENASRGAPAPVARKSNKGPILIAGTVGVVAAVVGLAMHFRSPAARQDAKTEPAPAQVESSPAAPAPTPAPAPIVPTPVPAPAPLVMPPAAATVVTDLSAADPRKFSNDRYRFEVTEKGFIQALSTTRDEVLVESAAGISLQGSYVGTDGRRKWFNVGGVDDMGYQATVKKSVKAGVTVFDVKVTHPRFELEQSFSCLADTVKVNARFTPINLRDPRGVIAAVHSVRLSPVALNPSLRMRASADLFAYAMKAGTLRVSFDNSVWARDGADGRQTIIAGENGVAFHFTESGDANRNTLNYEIGVP